MRLRNRLPEPLVQVARRLVTTWGMLTADLRKPPGLIVGGAQRAGTTTLFRLLADHPDIVRPTAAKGIGYFDVNYARGRRWYLSHFPLRVGRGGKVAFESSGYYLFHPLAPHRIAKDLPGVKVVVMVREPVERAYSAHKHELARGFESEQFEDAVRLEGARTEGEAAKIVADPAYQSFEHRHHSYLARSRYAEQIQTYVELLGRDRVHVVDADSFFADPVAEFHGLTDWLGVSRWTPDKVDQWNPQPRPPMSAELREELDAYFAPHDEALAGYLGRQPSWRTAPQPNAST
jgi:Sulfotransferase domain